MGYDIADYRCVMDEMGTIDDLRRLIAACHERGMRIILDLVVNHTSDEHPWFKDALANPEGAHGDYYFLRDGDPKTPPNNWTSFFSGPAWRRIGEKWALHLFTPEQPDLNWDNPAVRREVADIVRFWLAEGIDGFRLDVINYISKRSGLPDGNATVGQVMGFTGVEHYFHGPHLHDHLTELRREAFIRKDVEPGHEEPGADARPIMIGETPGAGVEVARLLTSSQRDELDLIFSFDHLETPGHVRWDEYAYDLNFLKRYYIDYQSRLGSDDWMSLFFENHDNPRMISKVNPDPRFRDQLGKALATILLTMRGRQSGLPRRVGAARRGIAEPPGRRGPRGLGEDHGRFPRPRPRPDALGPRRALGVHARHSLDPGFRRLGGIFRRRPGAQPRLGAALLPPPDLAAPLQPDTESGFDPFHRRRRQGLLRLVPGAQRRALVHRGESVGPSPAATPSRTKS